MSLEQAIRNATSWRVVGGDPNLIDVYDHASSVQSALSLQLPAIHPEKAVGVAAVEIVETTFIAGALIRTRSPDQLVMLALSLVEKLAQQIASTREHTYVSALFAWHGCLNMAKATRQGYVTGPGMTTPYTLEQRVASYEHIQQAWRSEESRGNTWVRYGVSLARSLEQGRHRDNFSSAVVEAWVPRDSPYWSQTS